MRDIEMLVGIIGENMFRIILICLVLSSCASDPKINQYAGGAVKGDKNLSLITSVCDSECDSLVKSKIEYFVPWLIRSVQSAILNEIDAKGGPNSARCLDCPSSMRNVYNEPGNYGFHIYIPSGKHTFKISKNYYQSNFDEKYPVTIETEDDHSYFIGNIFKDSTYSEWSPVIVDTTALKVLYPTKQPW